MSTCQRNPSLVPRQMYLLALFLHTLIVSIGAKSSVFQPGKVPPNEFDLVELNGFHKPYEAIDLCESHPHCAGFTYRGLVNNTRFPDMTFETYFFRFIPFVDSQKPYFNWVSYKTSRNYGLYQGTFPGTSVKSTAEDETIDPDLGASPSVAALVTDANGHIQERLADINMAKFVPGNGSHVTYFNFNVNSEQVRDTSMRMDMCCPAHDHKRNITDWKRTINDGLERISCDIDAKEFLENYVLPRKPVMLVGCIKDWVSTKTWTIKGLLQRYGQNATWKTDISYHDFSQLNGIVLNKEEDEDFPMDDPEFDKNSIEDALLTGDEILSLIDRNVTVRIFERLGVAARRSRQAGSSLKTDLYKDWNWPKPIPIDLFKPAFGGTDYQWVIMSQATTGTHVHHDPELTDAWNALLYGHKAWVLFPSDVYAEDYECDDFCSPKFDALFAVSWWTHVLPQLRQETWYGKKILETVQKPGEIIYVPHGMGHAVLNIDENLSITENFLPVGAMDELAKYYVFDQNPMQYDVEHAAERTWKNLLNRDLVDKKHRRYAKAMLQQIQGLHDVALSMSVKSKLNM
eukprot:maker-scaffold585_size130225-snap-gene-0.20 protein:Tk05222 transcript:maker-scaffold585_size130225-snap-gene-0.20-mRNA-1 annotation:"bifunctional arginine demethylase and lysyl-hydroxylase jmjd6-like"